MSLYWRIFIGFFLALLVTGGVVGAVTHLTRAVPASALDPTGAAVLGRAATAISQRVNSQGLSALESMERRRLKPYLFSVSGEAITPAPHYLRRIVSGLTSDQPRMWLDGGKIIMGPALVMLEEQPTKLFLVTRSRRAADDGPNFWLVVVTGAAAAALLALALSRQAARPVLALTAWAKRLGSDLNAPAPEKLLKRSDESGGLARALDGLSREVREQLEAQRALTRMVSHEVRTPLTRLKLLIDLLERDASAESFVPKANHQIAVLDRLLEQMLTLSRLETGAWSPEQSETTSDQLTDWLAEWSEAADIPGAQVVGEWSDDWSMPVDPGLLFIALDNLVRNSLSLAGPSSTVSVSAGDGVITVADDCGGVSEDELSRLTEAFVQGQRPSGGTGLGLAIVQQIAQLLSLELTLENADSGLRVQLVSR